MILEILALFLNISSAHAIIGGVPVSVDDEIAHTTVLIVGQWSDAPNVYSQYICTGTILNDEWVLTAAHCVTKPSKLLVVFSRNFSLRDRTILLMQTKTDTTPIAREAVLFNHNRDYDDLKTNGNDTGLVRFKGGLVNGYHSVTLLNPASLKKFAVVGQKAIIAGYGLRSNEQRDDGILYKTEVPINKVLEKITDVGSQGNVASNGDSGGPAFVQINGKYYQWGIASSSDCRTTSTYIQLKSNFFGKMGTPADL